MKSRIFVSAALLTLFVFAPVAYGQKKGNKAPAKPVPIRLPAAVLKPPAGTVMNVTAVDAGSREQLKSAAARIDELIDNELIKRELKPGGPLKEDQFLRRIYLELGGRIPTLQETIAYLDSKDEDKRYALIDQVLGSPDYVSHFYNYWADILRLHERPNNNLFLEPYLAYVKDSIRENKPFDRWVFEMLTADGKVWENPAVGFQLRDDGMPLPYVDNTVRVFLGTQIGCAQCHDHPFDHWTQKQFYELAALTAGTRTRPGGKDPELKNGDTVRKVIQELRARTPDGKINGSIQQVLRANQYIVRFQNKELTLPHDYAYSDAKPNEKVEPKVLWGDVPKDLIKADRRKAFATWVTSYGNRQFATTIANRLWKKMMGVGIVEPVDDFREDNPPSNPELLEHLTNEMLRLKFDMREFVRLISYTKTYQRRAMVYDPSSGEPFYFQAPALHRMTAEQIWDSILTLVVYNPWGFQRPSADEFGSNVNVDLANLTSSEAERVVAMYDSSFNRNAYSRKINKDFGYKGQVLVRASELPSPLPLGHFLRQFGQSDRETIEGSRTVATIPQILTMFNGPITHSMLERGSVIYDNVLAGGQQNAVNIIFLSILSRRPSAEDRKLAVQEVITAERPEAGYGNVIWALLNTREFIFIQ